MTRHVTVNFSDVKPLTLNERLHWAERNRRTQEIREDVGWLVTMWRESRKPFAQARVTLTVHPPDRRRRDLDNLSPTVKACIDGVVDAGLLEDDDSTRVLGFSVELREPLGDKRWHYTLRITESAEEGVA